MRHVKHIDVGMYQHQVGYTMYFSSGEKEHFLFDEDVAETLAKSLLSSVEQLRYLKNVIPGDSVKVEDSVQVRITEPKEDKGNDESGPQISVVG